MAISISGQSQQRQGPTTTPLQYCTKTASSGFGILDIRFYLDFVYSSAHEHASATGVRTRGLHCTVDVHRGRIGPEIPRIEHYAAKYSQEQQSTANFTYLFSGSRQGGGIRVTAARSGFGNGGRHSRTTQHCGGTLRSSGTGNTRARPLCSGIFAGTAKYSKPRFLVFRFSVEWRRKGGGGAQRVCI